MKGGNEVRKREGMNWRWVAGCFLIIFTFFGGVFLGASLWFQETRRQCPRTHRTFFFLFVFRFFFSIGSVVFPVFHHFLSILFSSFSLSFVILLVRVFPFSFWGEGMCRAIDLIGFHRVSVFLRAIFPRFPPQIRPLPLSGRCVTIHSQRRE